MLECSEMLCEEKAEVYCECETPAVIYCSEHGYEHFKETSHELQDIKAKDLGLNFSNADLSVMTGQSLNISDVLSGPSFFQRAVLKHLKRMTKYELEKIGIFQTVGRLLFETEVKYQCFVCNKQVSYVKLHLSKRHNLTESERQEHWAVYSSKYLEAGLIMSDIV